MLGVAKARLASLMRLFGVPRAACGSLVNFPYPGQDQTKRHVEKGQFFFFFFVFSGLCHHTQIGQGSCFTNIHS
uniref:Putative secreted protein n=1 Tax=Ixodes ricinus TaxID=34613 RepID=A0A6B0U4K4_IXORI